MPAVYNNLYVEQGATYNKTFVVESFSNLPGIATGQIRKSYNSANAVANFDAHFDSSNATVTLVLSAENTANINYGRYVYDVIVTSDSTITRIMEGLVDISPSVTR